jgi:hypothetical protein
MTIFDKFKKIHELTSEKQSTKSQMSPSFFFPCKRGGICLFSVDSADSSRNQELLITVFTFHLQMEYIKKLLSHSVYFLIETQLCVQISRICCSLHTRAG